MTAVWMFGAAALCCYDSRVDVWGCGIVLLQLLAGGERQLVERVQGEVGYGSLQHQEAWMESLQAFVGDGPADQLPPGFQDAPDLLAARDFVRCCCHLDPAQRWEPARLLEHEYLR